LLKKTLTIAFQRGHGDKKKFALLESLNLITANTITANTNTRREPASIDLPIQLSPELPAEGINNLLNRYPDCTNIVFESGNEVTDEKLKKSYT
jgi:hypothetical protein